MGLARHVEPEGQPEDLPVAESQAHGLLAFVLEQPQLLAEDLSERPVGDVAVGEAPAGALQRLRRLIGEPAPELTHESGLADACVAHQRHDMRLPLLGGVTVDRLQQRELRVAADECSRAPAQAARPHQRQCADERLRDDGL